MDSSRNRWTSEERPRESKAAPHESLLTPQDRAGQDRTGQRPRRVERDLSKGVECLEERKWEVHLRTLGQETTS